MAHIVDNLNVETLTQYAALAPNLASTTTTASGTLTLTVVSGFLQVITGTAASFSVKLPNATTLLKGWKFEIFNQNSVPINLVYDDGTTMFPIPSFSLVQVTLQSNTTTNGSWLAFRAFTGSASGILNYSITSSTPFSLSSGTADVVITGMRVTPVSGTYAIWYDGSISILGNNTTVRTAIYSGSGAPGLIITDSLRTIGSSVSTFNTAHATKTIAFFDGATVCEVRVARSSNSLTIAGRSLVLIRIGD